MAFDLSIPALNHSSAKNATIVHDDPGTIRGMTTFQERLEKAMEKTGTSPRELADGLGLTYQAVKKVVDGKTRQMAADNCAHAAKFLKVNHWWLATGEGAPKPVEVWPFSQDLQTKVWSLGPDDLWHAENGLRALLKMPPMLPEKSHQANKKAA